MKAKEIQELISFLSESGLEEVNIETDDIKVSIKRSAEQQIVAAAPAVQAAPAPAATPAPQAAPAPAPAADGGGDTTSGGNLVEIKSPMIGTFYRSANPESPAFVEVGSSVKVGDTVCIIEAMKLFNEIESEVSGKIVKVLVDNAQPVEYDQPLFLVEPA
ncbi:acetyl-CoA carboxylase biotin carboxyl carrier protein [Ekhidna sp.]|uniref:acetyl-CoA carboxylase biotin carboxyl carrier protein n=1 Tax=Ekhidna sp. TaxID=2608089 RepID=UPI003B4FFC9A